MSTIASTWSFSEIAEWDSLNHVNLMIALEQFLHIEIGEDLMVELNSVRSLREFAAKQNAEELARLMSVEIPRWAELVKKSGARIVYRLGESIEHIEWIYLKGDFDLIHSRLAVRRHRHALHLPEVGARGGAAVQLRGSAYAQRGANAHPAGGSSRLGGAPSLVC